MLLNLLQQNVLWFKTFSVNSHLCVLNRPFYLILLHFTELLAIVDMLWFNIILGFKLEPQHIQFEDNNRTSWYLYNSN